MSDDRSLGPIASADWHFWTTASNEVVQFETPGYPWSSEDGFWAPKEGQGTTPMFRFYSKSRNHHFWTTTRAELEGKLDFVFEGPKYHVYTSAHPGTQPLHRYNAIRQTGDFFHHFWTSHPTTEALDLWKDEGIVGYVYDEEPADLEVKSRVEYVQRFFAVKQVSNWVCSIQSRDGNQHYAKNIDGMSKDEAQSECNNYLQYCEQVDNKASSYQAVILPR